MISQRFILDERTYAVGDPAKEIIHPDLNQYQGPALLAYNNAIFTDTDFVNISRLGDSLKLYDGTTTGKFGRGFNSVGAFLKHQARLTDRTGV